MSKTNEIATSRGHIRFWASFEFFERGGEVYRAPIANPVMTDGYRPGRWECSRLHFDRFESVICPAL